MKELLRSKKFILSIVILGSILVCLFLFYETILIEAGRFLAPEETGKADVVILEGGELIREKPIRAGLELLSSRKATRLVIIVHQASNGRHSFALPDYTHLITKDLEALGLQKNQFQVIEVPSSHPITSTEAKIVLDHLSRSELRSAILISEGFHARRSFWAYKQAGKPLGIRIFSHPQFTKYDLNAWWLVVDGRSEFILESLKFFYYVIKGYIPLKSLFVT